MQITISTKNFELTSEIEEYVDKKINTVAKFYSQIIRTHVTLGKETSHHLKGEIYFAEAKMEVPGNDIFAKKQGSSMLEAVDLLKDYLELELKKHKAKLEKNIKKAQTTGRAKKEYHADETIKI